MSVVNLYFAFLSSIVTLLFLSMEIRLPESSTVISELSFALIPVSYLFGFSVSSPAIPTPLPVLLPASEPLSEFQVSSFLLSSAPVLFLSGFVYSG